MKSRTQIGSFDWRRHPLLTAFVCSCIIHLVLFLLWRMGLLELPDQLVSFFVKRRVAVVDPKNAPKPTNAPPVVMKEIPLTFIELEPNTAPAPKDPRFYSTANSVAANPVPAPEAAKPKMDGNQDKVPRLRDVPRAALPPPPPTPPTPVPRPVPVPQPPKPEMTLQPAPPKEPPPQGNTDQAKAPEPPKPTPKPLQPEQQTARNDKPAEPQPKAEQRDATPVDMSPKPKPRSLAAARQQAGLAGEKMRQEGGVHRVGKLSVDAKATPFGEYDAALIRAVQDRWYYLLDNTTAGPRSGKVVISFNLMYDGRVADVNVQASEVGEALSLLCQRAITDPAPYARWPAHMHQTVGGNVRPVTITFYYY